MIGQALSSIENPKMNIDEFWQIIDAVHVSSTGDMDLKCKILKERLSRLDKKDLRDFIDHFDFADAQAYTWPLWGAAYVIHGGCSDDSFSDFRATLISQGREIYERALADPESLAELSLREKNDLCYEGYQYVKNDVSEEKFGEILPRSESFPKDPTGEEWDEKKVGQHYPRLAEKYSYTDDNSDSSEPIKPWWKFW